MIFDSRFWLTFLTSIAGSGGLAFLLLKAMGNHLGDRWLERHKHELAKSLEEFKHGLDREMETYKETLDRDRKRIESQYATESYASQAYFDEQLKGFRAIFADLSRLKMAFNGIRQLSGRGQEPQQQLDLSRRLEELKEAYKRVTETIESETVFIPEEVSLQLGVCIRVAESEIEVIEALGDDQTTLEESQMADTSHARFTDAYEIAVNLVRQHSPRPAVLRPTNSKVIGEIGQ